MILYINTDTGKLQTSLSNQSEPVAPAFHFGDIPALDVRFVSAGAYVDRHSDTLFVGLGQSSRRAEQGQFYLSYGSVSTTDPIECNATAGDVQDALESIAALSGNVTVIGSDGGPWTVEFIEDLELTNVSTIVANAFTLIPLSTVTVDTIQTGTATINEIQAIRIEQQPVAQQSSWTAASTTPWAFTANLDLGTTPLGLVMANHFMRFAVLDIKSYTALVPTTRLRTLAKIYNGLGSGGTSGVPAVTRGTATIATTATSVVVTAAAFTATGSVIVTPILSTGGTSAYVVTKSAGSFTITVPSAPEIVTGDGLIFTFDWVIVSNT